MTTLLPILGDQLSPGLASLRAADRATSVVLMAEVMEEATYVRHHRKKIAFLFSAMRHFAERLRTDGWTVDYIRLDDRDNSGSLSGEIARACQRHMVTRILATEPGEWRVLEAMRLWPAVTILNDDRFMCSREDFAAWADGRKQLRMEWFYRDMRRRTGLLMDADKPAGGQWNLDAENRKSAKALLASGALLRPQPPQFEPDAITRGVLDLVAERFGDHIGTLEPFWFAVTPEQAEQALDHFIANVLPHFGDYQDTMITGEPFLYHAVLSPYINAGLLDPLAVCRRAEAEYHAGRAGLNAVEGFIRQIIGWREYVRGIYWREMPGYVTRNALSATRPLPGFYWTGDTDMACLKAAIGQTITHAYAHHIQRLMITGTFALLAGIDPHSVHEWYLAVYADAYEWVELPNTLGMSQFADGGLLGSKPYAASGSYIDRMSDYCRGCRYDVTAKTGETACPFNALYWDFLVRNRDTLGQNPRLGPVYLTWDKLDPARQAATRASAAAFLARLDGGDAT